MHLTVNGHRWLGLGPMATKLLRWKADNIARNRLFVLLGKKRVVALQLASEVSRPYFEAGPSLA